MEATVPNENRLEGSLALLGVNLAPLLVVTPSLRCLGMEGN